VVRIRHARAREAAVLEALQRRASDVWPEYREALAANPDVQRAPSPARKAADTSGASTLTETIREYATSASS
jgi:hypothetical protein